MENRIRVLIVIIAVLACLTTAPAVGAQDAGAATDTDSMEMVLWVNGWPQKAVDGIQLAADQFSANHPAVQSVTVQEVSQSELVEKLTLNVAGGTPPDVVTLPAPFVQYAIPGLLQPIDSYLDKSDEVSRQDYPPVLLESFKYEGREYGLPGIEASVGLLLVYNKEMFAEAGLPDRGPQSLEELYLFHQELTQTNAAGDQVTQLGIDPLDSMGGTYFPTIWSTVFDVDWYDAEARRFDLLAFEPAVSWLQQVYDAPGYNLIDEAGIGGWTGGLSGGKLGMQINGSWVPGELKSLGNEIPFGYTWMPTASGDKATAVLPWGMGIPSRVKHPDLSFALIEYFSTVEAAQTIFDAVGWLNGNLSAIRGLDIQGLPIIAQIVEMLVSADRLNAPAPVPIMEQVRHAMGGLTAVWRREQPASAVLTNIQAQLQAEMEAIN